MKKYTYTFAIILALFLASCVQEEHEKTLTFSVDMNGIENAGNVGIRGNFTDQQWRETVPLTDEDGDGIYTTTVSQKTAVYGIEFKFVNQGFDYELKDKENREIVFEYKPETIEYIAKFNNNTDITIHRN
jgi:major membrane immunogen (membrane-anchored lipoprotein)